MTYFWKKTTALLLLAIFAMNPLHVVLHASHDHSSHAECSTSDCKPELELKNILSDGEDRHDCYMCQNSQDRTYTSPSICDGLTVHQSPSQEYLCSYNTIIISKGIFFVDSRGPPTFI